MIGAANLHDFRRHNYGYTLSEFVEFVGWFLRLSFKKQHAIWDAVMAQIKAIRF